MTRTSEPTDSSVLIGISTRYGVALWILFVAVESALAIASLSQSSAPALALCSLVLLLGSSAILLRPHPDPFPLTWTGFLVGVIVVAAILNLVGMPPSGWPGFAGWHIGATTWMLFVLALRGRGRQAWGAYALVVGATAVWSTIVGRPLLDLVGLHAKEAGLLLIGTVFAAALRRQSRRIGVLTAVAVESAAQASALEATQNARLERLAELRRDAVPLLHTIAAESEPNADSRVEFAVVEARLRDSIRARSLAVPEIATAAEGARRRGVTVVLLDDRGVRFADESHLRAIVDAVVVALDGADSGAVTVRLGPAGRDVAATIVVQTESGTTRDVVTALGGG